ncbi:MAG: class II aldolase/adducin family protein [Solirubrobacteraceae bacterium]|nr:class II aldolase/adducin family protein [Solirubrobacteraceae bacterium]
MRTSATIGPPATIDRPAARDATSIAARLRGRRAALRVIRAARALVDEGLVVGTVGNVSARVGDRLVITPTRRDYATLRPRDLAIVDLTSGRTLRGTPSRELPLHRAVYAHRPDVQAVVHTHSVAATAWSFLGAPLEPELEDLAYHGIGSIRTSAPAPAGSDALATAVRTALGDSGAVLLGEHGVLGVGPDVDRALVAARVVEHQARVAWLLRDGRDPADRT